MNELVAGSAIVTGAGSGIGRAIALALAERGAAVGLVDVLPEGITELAQVLKDKRHRAATAQADVSRWEDVDRALGATIRDLGPVGILVNAAGILDGYASADEMSPALWERVIAINLTGTFLTAKRVLPEMLARRIGRIVNIASVAGVVGSGGGAAYTASKHGVVGLTRQLAITYADRGVTVNAIGPGAVTTGLRANSTRILGAEAPVMRGVGGDEAAVRAITPAGRRGTLEEIAAAACFLASVDAAYMTGHTLMVDGGWTAR
ncbi:MAG: SDR family NAD(P)-dependent oxidoreductase [Candidatus Rokuibacteriota bacterium]